jgi:hypothetical protein
VTVQHSIQLFGTCIFTGGGCMFLVDGVYGLMETLFDAERKETVTTRMFHKMSPVPIELLSLPDYLSGCTLFLQLVLSEGSCSVGVHTSCLA